MISRAGTSWELSTELIQDYTGALSFQISSGIHFKISTELSSYTYLGSLSKNQTTKAPIGYDLLKWLSGKRYHHNCNWLKLIIHCWKLGSMFPLHSLYVFSDLYILEK